jgi:Zn-finger nucleic acid-binding protein
MKCPECDLLMQTCKLKQVEIDECPQCKGVWFDSDELRKAKDEADPSLVWRDFDLWKHADRFSISPRARRCPKCGLGMAAVDYAETGVAVDCCAACKGVWLDAGEFPRIIAALEQDADAMSTKDYLKASFEEAKEVITGSEGLVSEWRDLTTVLRLLECRFFSEHPKLQQRIQVVQENNPF